MATDTSAAISAATKTKYVFKSRLPSSKYIFADGLEAVFIGGKYFTSDQSKIDELNKLVDSGHPHIYVDENEATAKEGEASDFSIQALKDKFIQEYLAEQEALKAAGKKDLGETNTEFGGISTSDSVQVAMSGSSSANSVPAPAVAKTSGVSFIPAAKG